MTGKEVILYLLPCLPKRWSLYENITFVNRYETSHIHFFINICGLKCRVDTSSVAPITLSGFWTEMHRMPDLDSEENFPVADMPILETLQNM